MELLFPAAIALATILVFFPSLSNQFLDYDDPFYVTNNPTVQHGLTLDGVRWAFTTSHFMNWLPVTWLSHMLDVQLYGLDPRGHHATSILLHCGSAALLYFLMRSFGRPRGESVAIAMLFAVHPLRVESVAWIAERKDVLCAFFFLASLLAYRWYTLRPGTVRYVLLCVLYALGLMSKTMIVTLPFLLLLLDWWPLGRWRLGPALAPATPSTDRPLRASWLIFEKLPLFALAMVASAWSMVLQREGGAMEAMGELSLTQRAANALVSVWRYIAKIAMPMDLMAFYPMHEHWPMWQIAFAGAMTLAVTIGVLGLRRRQPHLIVGWLWFVGMLVPVCGLVQIGRQSMADRYTYLPGIGLAMAAVISIRQWAAHRPAIKRAMPLTCGAVVIALASLTIVQQQYWLNNFDLFSHALEVEPNNWMARHHVGRAILYAGGRDEQAVEHLCRAVELEPTDRFSRPLLAAGLLRLGRTDEAIAQLRELLRRQPDPENATPTRVALGVALTTAGRLEEADSMFAAASRSHNVDAELYARWSICLLKQGRSPEAAQRAQLALALDPGNAVAKAVFAKATGLTTDPAP